jgi:hypothetical protein
MNTRPFDIALTSLNFYLLAASSPVLPRHGSINNFDRITKLGKLTITYTGHAFIFTESYYGECRLTKPDFFELTKVDAQFRDCLKWSFNLPESEVNIIMEEYITIKNKCLELIKTEKVLDLEEMAKYLPLIQRIKAYIIRRKGEKAVANWVM